MNRDAHRAAALGAVVAALILVLAGPARAQEESGPEAEAGNGRFDPNPVEGIAAPKTGTAPAEAAGALREVVNLKRKEKPFSRLPEPTAPPMAEDDARRDTLRLGPKAPPEPGEELLPFPQTVQAAPPISIDALPLRVVRHSPEGGTDLVDRITVAFNQPMVPMSALPQVVPQDTPIRIEPPTAGRILWLGTEALAFEPPQRLPLASRFTVTVPAGLRSAAGQALPADYAWSFETARPTVIGTSPYNGQGGLDLRPKITLQFNAPVELDRIQAWVELRDGRGKLIPLLVEVPKPAGPTDPPIRTSPVAAFVPGGELKPGTTYRLRVKEGLLCAEGPLPMTTTQEFAFSTYGPLKVEEISCSWGDRECPAGRPIIINFNNELAEQKVDGLVQVNPQPADYSVERSYSSVVIRGAFVASTSYTVKVSAGFKDVFGQTSKAGMTKKVRYLSFYPLMEPAREGRVVIESAQRHDLDLVSVNVDRVHVRLAPVPESMFMQVAGRPGTYWDEGDDPMAGLKPVVDEDLSFDKQLNQVHITPLVLDKALGKDGTGAVLLDLRSPVAREQKDWNPYHHKVVLIQVTDIGVTVAESGDEVVVRTASLDSGRPLSGVEVRALDADDRLVGQGKTGEDGVVRLPGPARASWDVSSLRIVAGKGEDRFILPLSTLPSYLPKPGSGMNPEPRVFVFSERGLYRPGELVNLTVIGRLRARGPSGDLVPVGREHKKFSYEVQDAQYRKLANGEVELSSFGIASFSVKTPKDAALGRYYVTLANALGEFHGSFQVEEYRVPEFKVETEWRHGGSNVLIWRQLEAMVSGDYYFGAPMTGAAVHWSLTRMESYFEPQGNPGYVFRDKAQAEFWHHWEHRWHWGPYAETVRSGNGQLGPDGKLTIPLTLDPGGHELGPVAFTLEATVTDENRQAIAGRSTLVAHRAERYVGLTVDRAVLAAGETVAISAVVTRHDGSRHQAAKAAVRLLRAYFKETKEVDSNGETHVSSSYVEEEVGRCELAPGLEPATCRLAAKEPGTYLVRAETRDLAGRPSRSALQLFVFGLGASSWMPNPSNAVEFVTDKPEYQPGDVARILVKSPFQEAFGLATAAREGFIKVWPLDVKNGVAAFELPLEEAWTTGVEISAIVARGRLGKPGQTPDDPDRPALASQETIVPISPRNRTVFLTLKPSVAAVEPGGRFSLAVEAKDYLGRPVGANVTLMVVDEAVLSLIGFQTPNPLATFYGAVSGGTVLRDMREAIVPRTKPKVEIQEEMGEAAKQCEAMPVMSSAMGAGGEGVSMKRAASKSSRDAAGPEFQIRQLFESTAFFKSDLRLGKSGTTTLDIKMPDNTSEFRIMAVAVDEARLAGSSHTSIVTRRALIVRPSLPRFLNLGDTFEAAVVVNNQTGRDTEVLVRCRALNAEVDQAEKRAPVAAGQAVEVRFRAQAGAPGPATFLFAAVALTKARDTDAAAVTIPTLIPATAEAFATYGIVEKAARQPLVRPDNVLPDFGGLELSMSSTALTGLQDAVTYLFEYPYECNEQLCSRLIPILSLGPILQDFRLGCAETPDAAKKLAREGIAKLLKRQREDGGWGFWPGSADSWLYMSAYAAMTLELARRLGFEVDDYPLQRAGNFLEYRLNSLAGWEKDDFGSQALAVLVLARLSRNPAHHVERLFKVATEEISGARPGLDYSMPIYAKAWLMEAMGVMDKGDPRIETLARQIENAGVETASALHFAERKSDLLKMVMHSEERTDAIVLGSLVAARPDSPLIEKVVRGLVRARVKGRWSTTQANAFALLALGEYYRLFEKEEPAFDARLWLGDEFLAGRRFQGRQMTIAKASIPMKALLEKAVSDLVVAKDGAGRLYYRLGLRYAPSDLRLKAEDRGFVVDRAYFPATKESRVERRPNGAWAASPGSYILVKIRVTAPDRRYFVAIVDPMPAGAEAVNEKFLTSSQEATGAADDGWGRYWRWWSPWDHEEKRDDRVQVFVDRMEGGVLEYSYVTRATSLGTFIIPPARAEEMYNPETFGRSSTDTLVVE